MTQEESAVEYELRRWGLWLGIQYAADGYSPMCTLAQLLCGRGSRVGHRVLCVDPPEHSKFWEYNRNVLKLKREHYEVLVGRYALPCKPHNGEPYKVTELAPLLGISPEEYLDRLSAARAAYRRVIFPDILYLQTEAAKVA